MAPRRGGGGGGGSSSISSSCPGAFSEIDSQVYFACVVVFFAVFLLISFATCTIRKKSAPAGKKLLGAPYIIALLLWLLAYGLNLISDVLRECDTTSIDTYISLAIAINVFYRLAYWALLFVAGYILNIKLRESLGRPSKIIKIVLLVIMAFIFAMSAGLIGVTAYNNWTQTSAGYEAYADFIVEPYEQLRIAYSVLFFLAVLVTSALSIMTVFAMRAGRLPGADLIGWIIVLSISMIIWTIIEIVFAAVYLQDSYQILDFTAQAALNYVQSFFQALCFVILLCIAKHSSWKQSAIGGADMSHNQQPVYYAYNADQQPIYYNQASELAGHRS